MSITLLAQEILECAKLIDQELNTPIEKPAKSSSAKLSFVDGLRKASRRLARPLRPCFIKPLIHRLSKAQPADEVKQVETSSSSSHNSINNAKEGTEFDQLRSLDRYDQLPENLESARDILVNKCHEMRTRIETPEAALTNIYTNWTELVSLEAVCHFRLFEAIPATGSATYTQIAEAAHIPQDIAARFIRICILNGIFSEPTPGCVHHTPRSRWLLTRGSGLLDLIALNCYELAPAGFRYPEAIEKYGAAEEPNQSPFALANNNLPIFEVLARDEKRRLRFGRSMQYLTSADSYDVRHILKGYDWAAIDTPGARALDVGGGLGHISALVAAHTKELHFTVQDLPPVVDDALANKGSLAEPHILARISFLPLSFFTPHSTSSPKFDVVFLRWIIHNWSDKYTRQIFRAMIPALRKGSQVFIIEYLLDEECLGINSSRAFGLRADMMMGVGFSAKERTASAIRTLLDEVAQEFGGKWSNWSVARPESSLVSFIRLVWEGVGEKTH